MKNALSRTLVDPRLADAEVIPTSTMEIPAQEPITPTEELVKPPLPTGPIWRSNGSTRKYRDQQQGNPERDVAPLDLFAYYGVPAWAAIAIRTTFAQPTRRSAD